MKLIYLFYKIYHDIKQFVLDYKINRADKLAKRLKIKEGISYIIVNGETFSTLLNRKSVLDNSSVIVDNHDGTITVYGEEYMSSYSCTKWYNKNSKVVFSKKNIEVIRYDNDLKKKLNDDEAWRAESTSNLYNKLKI
jgi:hypothetical protein